MQNISQAFEHSQVTVLALASFGLVVSLVIEQAQLLVKYSGVLRQRIAGGYNDAMKVMVLNRFGAALYFLLIALSIDLGMNAEIISLFFFAAMLIVAAFSLSVVVRLQVTNALALRDLLTADIDIAPVAMSMVAALFSFLGLTLPMLLAASNPDLRLTMANTGFILNSVFTIITVFFVESYLATIIDDPKKRYRMGHFIMAVFFMRFVGALLAMAVMLAISFHPEALDISRWFAEK